MNWNKLILMLAAMSLLSCKGNDSAKVEGNSRSNYGYGTVGGASLPGGEAIIARVISQVVDFSGQVNWQVSGQSAIVQRVAYSGATSIAKTYQGPAVARGSVVIPMGYQSVGCAIPPGTYNMVSTTPGTWNLGIFTFPQLTARMINGPVTLLMSANGVIIDPNGDGIPDQMSGTLNIQQVVQSGGIPQNCFVPGFSMF